ATLGVVRAGAAYVPVEPGWPAPRVASACEQAGIRHAVVAAGVDTSWPEGVRVHRLDTAGVLAGPDPSDVRLRRARADDLAYAIFTSGSTGRPKGVAVEHRQARTTLDEMAARFPLTPEDRVLALSALSFDLSVYDVFGALGAGAAMVLPEPDRQRDPGHWLELAARHRVSVWNSAPALLEMLVEYAEIDPVAATEALSALRLVLLSGDWIPITLPDRLRSLAPDARVVSLGGATEGSIWSICHPIGAVDPAWTSIPYGRALRGQSFHILDDDGRPCPVGSAGELYIGGDGVARGYVGDPEQTAQRFSHHPLLRRRLYRTGDLGRWRYDGTIEFLGRVDRQVKIRGHRIELGEVESVLDRAPGVRQCVARSVPGPDGRPRLVAYVVPADADTPPAEDDLVARLREHLPEYMAPSRFVSLPALPVTDNGKVDHAALPDPYRSARRPSIPASHESPSSGGSLARPTEVAGDEESAVPDGAEPLTVAVYRPTGVTRERGAGLAALLDDAVGAGLEVRVEVRAGHLRPAAALAAAARLAEIADAGVLPYRLTARVGSGTDLLSLDVAAAPDSSVPPPAVPAGASEPAAGPVDARADTVAQVDLPDPAVERAVAEVLSDLLGAPVDPDTPFFRLGATSLTLVQAHRRLTARVAPDLAIVDLFAHPTVRALARRITTASTPGCVTTGGGRQPARPETTCGDPGTDPAQALPTASADAGTADAASAPPDRADEAPGG
ncbi:amino acid adenylation domain-containing protein, partial [Micromonospora sp. NPDC049799]|uniref:amino acid adenylation domain-containing protein n=1 Tax=Micromonospora sp. NPDC049799 TaxID=3154741 RepID=UPI0033E9EDE1